MQRERQQNGRSRRRLTSKGLEGLDWIVQPAERDLCARSSGRVEESEPIVPGLLRGWGRRRGLTVGTARWSGLFGGETKGWHFSCERGCTRDDYGKAGLFSVERLKMDLPFHECLCARSEVPALLGDLSGEGVP